MPRYFFHVKTTHKTIIDDKEGLEFPDIDGAREEATRAAREIVDDMISLGEAPADQRYVIVDEAGQTVFEYAFAQVQPKQSAP